MPLLIKKITGDPYYVARKYREQGVCTAVPLTPVDYEISDIRSIDLGDHLVEYSTGRGEDGGAIGIDGEKFELSVGDEHQVFKLFVVLGLPANSKLLEDL